MLAEVFQQGDIHWQFASITKFSSANFVKSFSVDRVHIHLCIHDQYRMLNSSILHFLIFQVKKIKFNCMTCINSITSPTLRMKSTGDGANSKRHQRLNEILIFLPAPHPRNQFD